MRGRQVRGGEEGERGGLTFQEDARPSYMPEKQEHRPQSLFEVKGGTYTQFHASTTKLMLGLCSQFSWCDRAKNQPW